MTGWILVGSGIGGMVSPWLIGQLFESVSPRITMPVLLVNNLIAFGLLIALILPLRKKETTK
jgi:fluoride ion exporter CrcB/FEX